MAAFLWSVEGLHGGTWDPKAVPHWFVSGTEISLKIENFFFSCKMLQDVMYTDSVSHAFQVSAHYHPWFGTRTLLFYFKNFPFIPKTYSSFLIL